MLRSVTPPPADPSLAEQVRRKTGQTKKTLPLKFPPNAPPIEIPVAPPIAHEASRDAMDAADPLDLKIIRMHWVGMSLLVLIAVLAVSIQLEYRKSSQGVPIAWQVGSAGQTVTPPSLPQAGDLQAGDLQAGDLQAGDLQAGDLQAGDREVSADQASSSIDAAPSLASHSTESPFQVEATEDLPPGFITSPAVTEGVEKQAEQKDVADSSSPVLIIPTRQKKFQEDKIQRPPRRETANREVDVCEASQPTGKIGQMGAPFFGTRIEWSPSPAAAAKKAKEQGKMVFLIQVSGNFADSRFT